MKVVAVLSGETVEVSVNVALGGIPGEIMKRVGIDKRVCVVGVVGEDASVHDGGGGGQETGKIRGNGGVVGGEKMVFADEDETNSLSVLWDVVFSSLFVKNDMIVDDGCCLVYVGNKVGVEEKGGDVFKDDEWRTEKKNELKDSVEAVAGVTRAASTSEGGERLAWKTAGENVDANKMVKESWGKNVVLKDESALAWREVGGVLFDGCGTVIECDFDVYVECLECEGETANATEGIDGSDLRWKWRRSA